MLTPHRARDKPAPDRPRAPAWRTLCGGPDPAPSRSSHAALEFLEEGRFPPRTRLRERNLSAEVLTYVREGALAYEDASGRLGVVQAGEFQRMSLGEDNGYNEVNASSSHSAHAFQIWLGAGERTPPGHERRRFSIAERRGRLCVVASPDARDDSLRLQQDVVVYSGVLGRGQHVVHPLDPHRSAWLHVIEGVIQIGSSLVLSAGDGLSVVAEPTLSLTAHEDTEVLLVDFANPVDSGVEPPGRPEPITTH